jgi:hypothetical protein
MSLGAVLTAVAVATVLLLTKHSIGDVDAAAPHVVLGQAGGRRLSSTDGRDTTSSPVTAPQEPSPHDVFWRGVSPRPGQKVEYASTVAVCGGGVDTPIRPATQPTSRRL